MTSKRTQTSQRRGETWIRELCKFQTILKVANLKEIWILSPSLSNEKQFWIMTTLLFHLFSKNQPISTNYGSHSEMNFLWQHQCFDYAHRSPELRTDGDPIAWRIWSTSQNQLWQLRQPAPPLEFPGEQGMFTDMYAQVREEEQVISLQFICSQQDVSKRRRKKRKQVDDGTAIV